MSENLVLHAKNLVKKYGKRTVVKSVDIEVKSGEIVGLLGPNGAGKTTTFYMVTGLVNATSGHVFFNENDITDMPMYARARLGIGYLSQEESIFRKLTVRENLYAIAEYLNVSDKEKNEIVDNLLREFHIKALSDQPAYTLSGGERRRLEIARALVTTPKFLLMDEPFSGVDPISVNDIQNMILGLKDRGIGILITDHNVRETLKIVDRAYLIHAGKVICHGDSETLLNDENSRKFYLGEDFKI